MRYPTFPTYLISSDPRLGLHNPTPISELTTASIVSDNNRGLILRIIMTLSGLKVHSAKKKYKWIRYTKFLKKNYEFFIIL